MINVSDLIHYIISEQNTGSSIIQKTTENALFIPTNAILDLTLSKETISKKDLDTLIQETRIYKNTINIQKDADTQFISEGDLDLFIEIENVEDVTNKKQEMISALETFSHSFNTIAELFENDDFNGNDFPDVINQYPFDISFDELNIPEWCRTFISALKKQK